MVVVQKNKYIKSEVYFLFNSITAKVLLLKKKDIGNRIRKRREFLELNPQDVYSYLRISPQKYESIEEGSYTGNINNYYRYCFIIADMFKLNKSFLLLGNVHIAGEFEKYLEEASKLNNKDIPKRMNKYFLLD